MSIPIELRKFEISTPDGICEAHLAVPTDGGKYPGVLYLMDAFGVRPVIDEWIERIAGEGYAVLAPNLFYRNKRIPIIEDMTDAMSPDRRGALFQTLMPMMGALTSENLARDGKAYLDTLASQPETAEGLVGLTGYCLGARVAIKIAAAHPDQVAAVAGFHGGNLVTNAEDSPHLAAANVKAEVYMAYADNDQGATEEQQEKLAEALASAGVKHTYEVYKDAPHGYTMRDTAAYREAAAERHFVKLIDLLNRCLKR
jgi:carboxymethylenebutenolidase